MLGTRSREDKTLALPSEAETLEGNEMLGTESLGFLGHSLAFGDLFW